MAKFTPSADGTIYRRGMSQTAISNLISKRMDNRVYQNDPFFGATHPKGSSRTFNDALSKNPRYASFLSSISNRGASGVDDLSFRIAVADDTFNRAAAKDVARKYVAAERERLAKVILKDVTTSVGMNIEKSIRLMRSENARMLASQQAGMKVFKGLDRSVLGKLVKTSVVSEVFMRFVSRVLKFEERTIIKKILTRAKKTVKRTGKEVTKASGKMLVGGTGSIVSHIQPRLEMDASRFNKALRDYMTYTKRDVVEIVNQKAFWSAIGAFRNTYQADKTSVTTDLNAASTRAPGLTVAEFMALQKLRSEGTKYPKITAVRKEARKIINKRKGAVKFLKSGWLPAIKALAPFAPNKSNLLDRNTSRGNPAPKGGASPSSPLISSLRAEATLWNSIVADGDNKSHNYMVQGLESSMNEQAADMEAYVKRKMDRNAERFNRS